jgi:serine/threonine-protein kinase
MTMVYVPAGQFMMGSAVGDPDEKPVHTVQLDGFWLDRTEVTQAQYAACIADGGCATIAELAADSQLPVVNITWQHANAYCTWAGGHLPTEAEWEYAYRGPEAHRYPWGNTFTATSLNFCDGTCTEDWATADTDDGYAQLASVGTYPDGASWCNALDLAGNVWEWINDWYSDAYYRDAAPLNPEGPSEGNERVLRGGSWRSDPYNARGSYRFSAAPDQTDSTWGFRCARTAD